jgi:hypothetical protein
MNELYWMHEIILNNILSVVENLIKHVLLIFLLIMKLFRSYNLILFNKHVFIDLILNLIINVLNVALLISKIF